MIQASLATYKPRIKDVVWDAVESLYKQVDVVFLNVNTTPFLTEREKIEVRIKAAEYPNLHVRFIEEDYGDLSKFIQLVEEFPESNITQLICDDDLIYPDGYANACVELLDTLCEPISFGGKQLKKPPYKNFRSSFQTWTHVLKGSKMQHRIDLPLTCVTAVRRNLLKQGIHIERIYKNKGDVLFAKWAKQSNVDIICPLFNEGYFKYNDKMTGKDTIWDDMKRNPKVEEELAVLLKNVYHLGLIK